jgi:hypothetical protein
MRKELFAPHLPNPDRLTADYTILADPAKWTVTLAMLKNEITKVTKGPRRIWVVVILRRGTPMSLRWQRPTSISGAPKSTATLF